MRPVHADYQFSLLLESLEKTLRRESRDREAHLVYPLLKITNENIARGKWNDRCKYDITEVYDSWLLNFRCRAKTGSGFPMVRYSLQFLVSPRYRFHGVISIPVWWWSTLNRNLLIEGRILEAE